MKRLLFAVRTILVIGLIALSVLFAWRRSSPALIRITTQGLPETHHILILNPFQSVSAERCAERFLKVLETKDVPRISQAFPLVNKKQIEFDASDPPVDWKLDDAVESANKTLAFKFFYAPSAGGERGNSIWVYCARDQQGSWTVTRYDRIF